MERNKKVGIKGHKQVAFEVCLAIQAICHVECCRDTEREREQPVGRGLETTQSIEG